MQRYFSKNSIAALTLTSAFLAFYIDFFSKNQSGTAISLLLFAILLTISITNLSTGIIATWSAAVLIPEFPRDILDVYSELQVEKTLNYNTIASTTIGPLTLLHYLFFLNTALALINIKNTKIRSAFLLATLSFSLIGSIGLFSKTISSETPPLSNIITDSKLSIFLTLGLIQGFYLKKHPNPSLLTAAILTIPTITGARALIFIIFDFATKSPKLDLMTTPLIATAVFAFLLYRKRDFIYKSRTKRSLLLISLINASRGLITIQLLFLSIFYLRSIVSNNRFSFTLRRSIEVLILTTTIIATISVAAPRAFNFLLWKVSDIKTLTGNKELSGSGKVRYYELANVLHDNQSKPLNLIIGSGLGAHFTFEEVPLPNYIDLDLKSYNKTELSTGRYYNPHSFITTIILKYGILGLLIYILIPTYTAIRHFKSPAKANTLIALAIVLNIYTMYWRVEIMILTGIALGLCEKTPKPANNALT